jgi:hypothetical protein
VFREMIVTTMDFFVLPGGDLIEQGLSDLRSGREETIPALLVLIGAARLRRAGIDVPEGTVENPEHRLYETLCDSGDPSPHSLYNALVRRLVSFERSVECARR